MIKRFLSMLKEIGKKGQLGKNFIEEHAHKSEEELRKKILEELKKVEDKEKRLKSFRTNLSTHDKYEDFRNKRKDHFERVMDITGSVLDEIKKEKKEPPPPIKIAPEIIEEVNVTEVRPKETNEEDEIKKYALQIYGALKGKVNHNKIYVEIKNQKTEGGTWLAAAMAANNKIIKELRDSIEASKKDKGSGGEKEVREWLAEVLEGNEKKIDKVMAKLRSINKHTDLKNAQEAIANREVKLERHLLKSIKDWSGWKKLAVVDKGLGKALDAVAVKTPWWMLKTGGRAAAWGGKEFIKDWNPNFFIVLAILIWLLDMDFFGLGTSFNGISVEQITRWSIWEEVFTNAPKIFFNGVVLVSIVFYWVAFGPSWRELLSFSVMAFTTALIVSLGALSSIVHLILIYFLYLGFIGPVIVAQGGSKSKAHYLMALFLIIDYVGYGLLAEYVFKGKVAFLSNRFIYPIWFYFTAFYAFRVKSNTFTKVVVFLVLALNVWAFAQGVPEVNKLVDTNVQAEITEAKGFWEKAKEGIEQAIKKIKTNYQTQLEYATGGYYEGQVEENENLPLGVYFEDITSAAREFYVNEPVDIWGNLLVRTLDRDSPVTVSIDCQYEEERIPGTVRPEDNFTIYTMEEEAIECRFDEGTIPIGTRVIKLTADFNFKTMAYLKSYMIDKDTLRSLRREEIDVFDHYGIRDKNPIAIFTSGPVKIGMETNEPPIGLSEGATPYLGITIENQWSGNIKDIRELEVQVPKGMKFFDGNCDGKFNELTEGELNPEHHTYALNGKGRTYLKMPIEKEGIPYRSLRCLMKVYDKEMLLGDVPFTTKYFRATVSYDYELEHEVSVDIKKVPIISTYYETTIAKTNDELINYIDNKLKIERPDGEKGDFRGFIISNGLVKDLNIKLIDNSRIKEIINGELQGKNYNEETKEKIMGCYFGKILKQESNYHQFVKSGTTYPPYTKPGEDDNYKLVVNDKGKSNDGCCIGISQMNVKHKDKYSVYNLVVDSEYNVLKGLDLFLRYLAEKNGNLDEAAKAYNDGEEYSDHCSGEVDLTPVTTTTTSTTTTTTV